MLQTRLNYFIVNSPEITAFIRENRTLFWYTPEDKKENISLEMQNRELEAKLASLVKEMGTVKKDIADAQVARDKAVEDYSKISAKYNELQNAQEELVNGNVKETQKLLTELQAAQENLQKKEVLRLR